MNKHALLIVDDEAHILVSLKKILQEDTREIYTAKDAEDAFQILKEKGEMEVILCDNKLPGLAGIDFLTKIKPLYPDTIRILITGYPDLNSAMEAINKAHIWRFLLKPIEVDELKILINQAFDYFRILRENRLLLQIARQQQEWLRILKEKHPQLVIQEIEKSGIYTFDEKHISDLIAGFMKKYYSEQPQSEKE